MSAGEVKAVVFDIGGVLIEWDPHLAWLDQMGSREAVAAFLERVDFPARNLRGDGGETFADLAAEISDPEDSAHLAAYVAHYHKAVPAKIEGTWALLHRLKAAGVPVHGITNWSAETWPEGLTVHPELAEIFEVLVVSGQEKMLKPEARIFDLLCSRAGLEPGQCLFIDDALKNVQGAQAAGMDAVQFTDPATLERDLMERGLL
ncbi:HAD family hydrolase [Pseudooceanicola sp. 502str34]|uniref:HAD family hydrolase n=1 Tax=Maritimibacter alkaliphilus TaxID=404236 RepID=UPI001C955AC6|nr:HAD family phosphatase [Maritimibacter alkaliphilus]MBY6089558.1 HAD family phosphatase [Maritimibacter alkaliphilus]